MPVEQQYWYKGDTPLTNKNALVVHQCRRTNILKAKWLPKAKVSTRIPAQIADTVPNGMYYCYMF